MAQDTPRCVSPAESAQTKGAAQLIGNGPGAKQYAVVFTTGDEVYSGLMEFANEYCVTSGHFTAIGALSRAVLAWFDPQKKLYGENL